jgi:DNA-binding response OmpR family regulator
VASNPPTSLGENLPRGILLVEEYSALAVAISSALRKFAPLHAVEVVRGFAEAEAVAASMRPELFVLDLDPPPNGEIEFFNNVKAHYPEARVLVIAAGTSRELRVARGTTGALQFIEKPFDLADFGAAVQALLGPWTAPSAAGLRGTLRNLHVIDMVELKCLAGSTAVVRVEAAENKAGEIHFQVGQISHASTGALEGVAALEEIVRWPGARLSEAELPVEPRQTIEVNWESVLLQVVRNLNQQSQSSLGKNDSPSPAVAKTGKKILVVDDTEMLLIFVADVLATAEHDFQILTASSGAEGLRLAGSERPDLLLLDYCLTDMMGDEVCRVLLENPVTARIPVLLMSGHLSELARTAEDYENVVAALPKPFLSGALIETVEKVLAAGLLPRPAQIKPATSGPASPARPTPKPRKEGARPSPNGHGVKPASDVTLIPSKPAPPPVAIPAGAAKTSTTEPPSVPAPSLPSPAVIVRPAVLNVTLTLEAVALQFTASLQLEKATLRPFDRFVAVKMGQQKEGTALPLESGYEVGEISLNETGQIGMMRLIRTHQAPDLPLASRSFAVGASRLQQIDADSNLQLTAAAGAVMCVRLSAEFDLVEVELSIGLEVAAIQLKARPRPVLIHDLEGAGRAFEVLAVQLDSAAALESLVVRPLA